MTDLLEQADQPQVQCTTTVADTAKTIFIYGLRCPVSGTIRYVGQTANPPIRLRHHLNENSGTYKCRWIQKLKRAGLTPSLEILEAVPYDEWRSAERKWIAALTAQGCRLTNSTAGGYGPGMFAPHVKAKMSEFQKIRWANMSVERKGEIREKMAAPRRGRKATPEQVERLRQANLGRRFSAERRASMQARHKRRWDSMSPDERRERTKHLASLNHGRVFSPETRKKLADASRGKCLSPESRVKAGLSHKKWYESLTDEGKQAWVDRLRSNLPTPEDYAKVAESLRGIKRPGASSGFRGVSKYMDTGKWKAWIHLDGRAKHLGYFIYEEAAAIAYDLAAIRHFGDKAHLNFPRENYL